MLLLRCLIRYNVFGTVGIPIRFLNVLKTVDMLTNYAVGLTDSLLLSEYFCRNRIELTALEIGKNANGTIAGY